MRKHSGKRIKQLVALTLALIIALSTVVCCFAADSLISADTTAQAKEMAKQIQAEGTVLLKNEDNVLPLTDKKVNVFGAASCSLAFAGAAGSGAVRASEAVGFYDALTNAGIDYNKEIYDVYAEYTDAESEGGLIDYVGTVLEQFFSGGQAEMPISKISDSMMSNAKAYSQTAIIVIGRVGTEMKDMSVEDLNLNDEEKKMIDKVCNEFSDVIVVFNISNIMNYTNWNISIKT